MIIPQSDLDKIPDNSLSNYVYVALHHTACNNQHQSAEEIAQEEKARGYSTIPYNFVIDGKGKIEVGRPINKLPAATGGMNTTTLAICFEGNFESSDVNYAGEKPTPDMIHSAIYIINEWLKPKCHDLKYVIGHRDASVIEQNPSNATACPGNLAYAHIVDISKSTGLKLVVAGNK